MRRDKTQLERIIEEIEFIQKSISITDKETFLSDDLLQHAITMSLITIGECANHLSDEFKNEHAEIEWIQIIAARNIAAHGYWQLSMEQIWQAIVEDIPRLKDFIKSID